MADKEANFTPPHSKEAEKSVLSACLVNPQQLHVVIDKAQLKAEHLQETPIKQSLQHVTWRCRANFDIVTIYERIKTASKQEVSYAYLAK